jgi:hypothetical protein
MAKKPKSKSEKIDGLGPDDLKKIHKAVRQVWSWSHPRRLAVARATGKDGFPRCEKCRKRVPKVAVDHIEPVGEIGGPDYIRRMWCPSSKLQCLCRKCHAPKTQAEARERAKTKRAARKNGGAAKARPRRRAARDLDFY